MNDRSTLLRLGLSSLVVATLLVVAYAFTGDTVNTTNQELARIDLSAEAEEAIDNGVRLVFDARYATSASLVIFSRYRTKHQHQFFVQRHSLSNRYIVRRDNLEIPRIFRSIQQAMRYISQQALILLEFYNDGEETVYMRLALDKYALPGPMRLNAFIASAWDIDTGWLQPQE